MEEIRALAASMLIDAHPTPYRALHGWVTGLPLGLDRLAQHRSFDTDALAAAFPFASPELPAPDPAGDTAAAAPPGGVLYGHNLGSRSLVFWDRFACDNYNSVILGRSGAGKSYLVKLELLRSLYRGIDAHVIDPEHEYTRLAAAVGGHVVAPGAPGVHLNPFDLPITARDGRRSAPRDALTRRALFLHTFLAVLLGEPLSPIERAVLDTAITDTYTAAGITDDPSTWDRPAPLLTDLRQTLTRAATDRPDDDQPGNNTGNATTRAAVTRCARPPHGWRRCCTRSPTAPSPSCSASRPAPARTRTWSSGRCGSCPSRCARSAPCSRWTRSGPGSPTPPTGGRGWSWSTRRGCCCSNPPAPSSCCARRNPGANTGPG